MTIRGLTLGKFAPFHRGHQLVIETALAECDEVVALLVLAIAGLVGWHRDRGGAAARAGEA